MMTKLDFIGYCINRHDVVCNQKYDNNLPYSKHLEFVAAQAKKFKHLLGSQWIESSMFTVWDCVEMGCWGHDLIEDARVTYNDIVERIGATVANIIYCCTEEKGKNRDERHSEKYYKELANNKLAIFVKLCDIMANSAFSILSNSSMIEKHRKEHKNTLKYLYINDYKPMYSYLDNIFLL